MPGIDGQRREDGKNVFSEIVVEIASLPGVEVGVVVHVDAGLGL